MIKQRLNSFIDNLTTRWLFKHNRAIKITVVTLLLSSQNAIAEQSLYEIHYLLVETDIKEANYEPNALLYKHIVPYNSFINLEGIVALGISEEKALRKVGIAGTYTQKLTFSNMLGLMVSFSGAVEPRVHAFAHFGLTRVEFDISTPSSIGGPDGSQSETGLAYGFGMTFKILKTGAFVLEFNRLPDVDAGSDVLETSVLSIGYQMPF